MKKNSRKLILKVMFILSIIGILISGYQVYEHYSDKESICDFSANFSCSAVTESRFGEFPIGSGIALSIYGIFWFIVLTWLLWGSLKGKERFKKQDFYTFAYLASGVGFVVYLLIVELYILPKEFGEIIICPFCTVLHAIIFTMLVLSYKLLKKSLRTYVGDIFIEK